MEGPAPKDRLSFYQHSHVKPILSNLSPTLETALTLPGIADKMGIDSPSNCDSPYSKGLDCVKLTTNHPGRIHRLRPQIYRSLTKD